MRCQNRDINSNRCTRSADKIVIVKDITNITQQSKLRICNECFGERMYSDQLFKEYLIQVTELNKKGVKNEK